ncbi:MAG: biopolymer transporter ExbD, partial [Candidatus Fibromonas sp.]|nr:biopolymer transporter ExbD [Candidatus Fibromonas sp.]
KEMDMLPVMSLMTVLIPVLLTMTAFQKLAIVEINLPERSEISMDSEPPPPDDNALNLTVALSKEYVEIWARGGSLPKVFFKEMWTFRCKSDNDTITYDPNIISASNPPKCQDGSVLDGEKYKYSIESINLWSLHKESEEDPGKILMSVYSRSDSAYLDGNNEFITTLNEIKPGATVATLAESSARRLACGQSGAGVEDICSDGKSAVVLKPRSAYDELAKSLIMIHNRFIDSPDADNIIVLADDDTAFDKIISVMDRARDAGFFKINLAKLAAGG